MADTTGLPTLDKSVLGGYDTILNNMGSASDYAKGLNGMENDAFGQYLKAQQGQQTPTQIYNQLETQNGLPELRKTSSTLQGQVNDLEDTIRQVEPNVSATTSNSYVTEGQRNGMVTAQKQPLLDTLSPLSEGLGRTQTAIQNAESTVNNQVGYAVQGNQMALDPYKENITMVQNQAARMMTGYTSDKEDRLSVLLAKYKAQGDLSIAEYNEANTLANMEKEYGLKKDQLTGTSNNQMIDLGGSQKLINPATGEVIANYTNTLKPTASSSTGYSGISDYYGGGNSAWEVVG